MTMLMLLPNCHTHFDTMSINTEGVVVTVNTVQILPIGLKQKLPVTEI